MKPELAVITVAGLLILAAISIQTLGWVTITALCWHGTIERHPR